MATVHEKRTILPCDRKITIQRHIRNNRTRSRNSRQQNLSLIAFFIASASFYLYLVSSSTALFGQTTRSNSSNSNSCSSNNKNDSLWIHQSGLVVMASKVISSHKMKQSYKLLEKTRLSHDSFLLRYGLPEGRAFLGTDPLLPTCIKIDYHPPQNGGEGSTSASATPPIVTKSYSPVSHPNQEGYFDLIIKSYPYREGGGVGKYLCDMDVGSFISAQLKGERVMHGSPSVLNRGWKHVGLVAGGTGIAPLLQIARIILEAENGHDNSSSSKPSVHLLFVNHTRKDILGREAIEALAREHPHNFFVTYALTRDDDDDDDNNNNNNNNNNICDDDNASGPFRSRFVRGRGDAEMALAALPVPSANHDTMLFVCGKDGFVAHWAGPIARAPTEDGSKGPKIQGPLLGVLADAGFSADQVFKY